MIRLLLSVVTSKLTRGVVFLAILFWQAYTILMPKESDIDLLRQTAAQVVV